MPRMHFTLLLTLAAALAAPSLPAQQPAGRLAPADTRPSLTTPPSAPQPGYSGSNTNAPGANYSSKNQNFNTSNPQYQPLESYPRANTPAQVQSRVISQQPAGACECTSPATVQQAPTTTLSPVQLPPASYSSTYVPPPPTSSAYAGQVSYQRPVVYRQAVASPVYRQPVGPPGANYALSPIIPVRNVPTGAAIGRGVLGQPTVYVPGQPVRNFLRYLAP